MPTKNAKTFKCSCNLPMLLVALVVLTLGVFVFVQGFATQLSSLGVNSWKAVLPWYFFGLLLLVVGKLLKKTSHANCQLHGNW